MLAVPQVHIWLLARTGPNGQTATAKHPAGSLVPITFEEVPDRGGKMCKSGVF